MTQKVKIVNETIKHKRKNEGIQEEKKTLLTSSAGLSHLHSGRTCCSGLLLLLVTLGGTADYDADEDGQTDHCSYHNACYLTGLSAGSKSI